MEFAVAFLVFIIAIRLPWVWWWEKVHRFTELQNRAIDAEETLAQQQGNVAHAGFQERRKSTRLIIYGVSTFICFVYVLTCAALIFTFHVNDGNFEYSGIGAWGPVGDFFGGMLNPILAFASFIALLYTIRIQSNELELTRREFQNSVEAQRVMAKEAKKQTEYAKMSFIAQQVSAIRREVEPAVDRALSSRNLSAMDYRVPVQDLIKISIKEVSDNKFLVRRFFDALIFLNDNCNSVVSDAGKRRIVHDNFFTEQLYGLLDSYSVNLLSCIMIFYGSIAKHPQRSELLVNFNIGKHWIDRLNFRGELKSKLTTSFFVDMCLEDRAMLFLDHIMPDTPNN